MELYLYLRPLNSFKLFMWLALISTVASVPTSVLVQDSELASNAQQTHKNSNNHFITNNDNAATKVKRSSESNTNDVERDNNNLSAAIINKKSSPEIVPASYTAPPKPKSLMTQLQEQQQQQRQDGDELNLNKNEFEKNNDLLTSAIAAGLTAAAVEAAAVAANQHELEQLRKQHKLYADNEEDDQISAAINKRGISAQQQYHPYRSDSSSPPANLGWSNFADINNDFSNGGYSAAGGYDNPYGSFDSLPAVSNDVPQGTWADQLDPGNVVYADIDDYVPASKASSSYRKKAYDNLQNILNSESYLNTVFSPYRSSRYNGAGMDSDRSKRTYKIYNQLASKLSDMRLKRDTKLTPADMLALVALVEAGERARKDTDTDDGYSNPAENYIPKKYGVNNIFNTADNVYDYPLMPQIDDSLDYGNNAWFEPQPAVDYYGMPLNMNGINKYYVHREIPRERKYIDGLPLSENGNRYNIKRFMVAKKKRSIAKPAVPFKSEKFF